MEIMPVPTCCELHAHNYTYIPIFLGRRGTPDPTGQLVVLFLFQLSSSEELKSHSLISVNSVVDAQME